MGTDFDLDGGLIARCVTAGEGKRQDYETCTMVAQPISFGAQMSVPQVDFNLNQTLQAKNPMAVAHSVRLANTSSNGWGIQEEATHTLDGAMGIAVAHSLRGEGFDASEDGTRRGAGAVAVAFPATLSNSGVDVEISPTLGAHNNGTNNPATLQGMAVRRLTPRECERLQGFQWLCSPSLPGAWQDEAGRWWSPDYTAIPWRKKPADQCPDGPRYKALGNSWAVPVVAWIGRRIAAEVAP